jgi:ribosomal protein L24
MVNNAAEDTIFEIGDNVRLRFGAYAGKTGIVMRVYPYNKDQGTSDAMVMVRFVNGGNNSCYMSNLEKVEEPPEKE